MLELHVVQAQDAADACVLLAQLVGSVIKILLESAMYFTVSFGFYFHSVFFGQLNLCLKIGLKS